MLHDQCGTREPLCRRAVHFLLHMHSVDLVERSMLEHVGTVLWKKTQPKVILASSSSGAGVWCLLIFHFNKHDKFIKIAFAVNHSGREEVLTSNNKPKDIFLFYSCTFYGPSTIWDEAQNIYITNWNIYYLPWSELFLFQFILFISLFFILGLLKLYLNMRYK